MDGELNYISDEFKTRSLVRSYLLLSVSSDVKFKQEINQNSFIQLISYNKKDSRELLDRVEQGN